VGPLRRRHLVGGLVVLRAELAFCLIFVSSGLYRNGQNETGMPAWLSHQRPDAVWPVVAFVAAMPQLRAVGFAAMTALPEPAGAAPFIEAVAAWTADNQPIKPESRMPPCQIIAEDDLATLARYLESLD